jgi:hypothetical protein
MNWLPQNDVLAHPRTRAFLSHVGINSFYEVRAPGLWMESQVWPLVCRAPQISFAISAFVAMLWVAVMQALTPSNPRCFLQRFCLFFFLITDMNSESAVHGVSEILFIAILPS